MTYNYKSPGIDMPYASNYLITKIVDQFSNGAADHAYIDGNRFPAYYRDIIETKEYFESLGMKVSIRTDSDMGVKSLATFFPNRDYLMNIVKPLYIENERHERCLYLFVETGASRFILFGSPMSADTGRVVRNLFKSLSIQSNFKKEQGMDTIVQSLKFNLPKTDAVAQYLGIELKAVDDKDGYDEFMKKVETILRYYDAVVSMLKFSSEMKELNAQDYKLPSHFYKYFDVAFEGVKEETVNVVEVGAWLFNAIGGPATIAEIERIAFYLEEDLEPVRKREDFKEVVFNIYRHVYAKYEKEQKEDFESAIENYSSLITAVNGVSPDVSLVRSLITDGEIDKSKSGWVGDLGLNIAKSFGLSDPEAYPIVGQFNALVNKNYDTDYIRIQIRRYIKQCVLPRVMQRLNTIIENSQNHGFTRESKHDIQSEK